MEVKHGCGEEQGARLKSRKPFAVFRGRVEGLWGLWHLEREVQSEIVQEGRDGAEKLDFSPVPESYQVLSGKEMTSSGLS